MDKKFEREFNSYREELSLYLRSNNLTLVEYAEALGEEYISPILYPQNTYELDKAKKSFEMYRTINESKQYFCYDSEDNFLYAIYQAAIEETVGNRNYTELENALYNIFSDSKLRGKLRVDMISFSTSKKADIDILNIIGEKCTNQRNPYILGEKVDNVISSLLEKATTRVLRDKPELYDYLLANPRIKGMQKFMNLNQDIYNYIVSENINISHSEKKLN